MIIITYLVLLSLVILNQFSVHSLSCPRKAKSSVMEETRAQVGRRNVIGQLVFGATLGFNPMMKSNAERSPIPGLGRFQKEAVGQWSPTVTSKLGKRIILDDLSPIQQLPFSEQELYYPSFLKGSWKATATLKQKVYPFGKAYVPSNSLIEGSPRNREEQVGSSTTYDVHYIGANKKDENKVVADRSFNAIALSKAYRQLVPVQEVDWNPQKDPTRLSISYGAQPLAEDMRPLGPRRGEVYILARQSEAVSSTLNACSERTRSVTVATRDVIVSDTESITEFELLEPNYVKAVNRIAVYLTPNPNSREGVLWSEVGGKAVVMHTPGPVADPTCPLD